MTTDPERPAIAVTDVAQEEEVFAADPAGQQRLSPDDGEADLGLADRQTPDDS